MEFIVFGFCISIVWFFFCAFWHSLCNVKNLFVAGEAVGGIHGRNRLMGNSLLDVVVFGRNAGIHAAAKAKTVSEVGALNLDHVAAFEKELGPGEIVEFDADSVKQLCPPGKEIRCKPLTEYWFGSDTKLPIPAVSDNSFAFIGWYDNPGLSGSPVTKIPKGSTGDKTFYAKWVALSYTVTLQLNGGSLDKISSLGFYFLILLMIVVLFNDIWALITKAI